jgi:hypothetical protein
VSSLTIAQRRDVDFQKEHLVQAAEKLLDDFEIWTLEKRDFGDSQLRNVIAVTMETVSPAVIVNFIRYQIGRDNRRKGWGHVKRGKSLGELFIEEINGADGVISRCLKEVKLAGATGPELEVRQLARMELIRQFFGFASRYLKYLDLKRGGGQD